MSTNADLLAQIAKKSLKKQLEEAMMSTPATDNSAGFQPKNNHAIDNVAGVYVNGADLDEDLPTVERMRAPGRGRKQFVGVIGTNENEKDGFKGFNTVRTQPAPDEENAMMWVQTATPDEVAEHDALLDAPEV